jgi:hypothetical protein
MDKYISDLGLKNITQNRLGYNRYSEAIGKRETDVIPKYVYDNLNNLKNQNKIDFYVGGSYALKLFTNADWKNKDIDIFIQIEDDNQDRLTKQTILEICDQIIDKKYYDKSSVNDDFITRNSFITSSNDIKNDAKNFRSKIIDVRDYKIPETDSIIQLIFMTKYTKHNFVTMLTSLLDFPAHILYKYNNGSYIFTYPDRYLKNYQIKEFPQKMSHSSDRTEKYKERGYKFV